MQPLSALRATIALSRGNVIEAGPFSLVDSGEQQDSGGECPRPESGREGRMYRDVAESTMI